MPHVVVYRILYTSLVHPYLDYACVVWCPFQLGDTRVIEKVQRWATKIVPLLKDKSYYDRLVSLNLPSLLYIRRRMDMIMVYLIVKGLEGISFDRLFIVIYPKDIMVINSIRIIVILILEKNSLKGVSTIGTVYPKKLLNPKCNYF